ncbi:MAG: hypothetical protein K2I57_03235, partial [Muribaculaceae bacterium]|nr:hypothetical protein [Muribaculaceae bacterium]
MQDSSTDIIFRKEISRVLIRCRKDYRMIIVTTLAALVLAGAYLLLRQPKFTANASVMIANDMSAGSTAMSLVRQFSLGNMLGGSGSVHDELSMLSSHTTLMGAIRKLGANTTYVIKDGILSRVRAYPGTPVRLVCQPSVPDTLSSALVFKLSVTPDGIAKVKARRGFRRIGTASGTLPLTLDL